MTLPTTRSTPPAALPRLGRDRVALPADPGLDALLADLALGSTAKTIALALVKHWAWYKDHCWPSDLTIALKIGKSRGTSSAACASSSSPAGSAASTPRRSPPDGGSGCSGADPTPARARDRPRHGRARGPRHRRATNKS